MHLLIRVVIFFLMFYSFPGCKAAGPLTPADSYIAVQGAIEKNDIKLLGKLVSSGTKAKIIRFREVVSALDKEQLIIAAEFYNTDPSKLSNIDFYGSLALYFSRRGDLSLREIFDEDISTVDISGKKAVIRTEKGLEIDFIKEGPYWKLDLSEL